MYLAADVAHEPAIAQTDSLAKFETEHERAVEYITSKLKDAPSPLRFARSDFTPEEGGKLCEVRFPTDARAKTFLRLREIIPGESFGVEVVTVWFDSTITDIRTGTSEKRPLVILGGTVFIEREGKVVEVMFAGSQTLSQIIEATSAQRKHETRILMWVSEDGASAVGGKPPEFREALIPLAEPEIDSLKINPKPLIKQNE